MLRAMFCWEILGPGFHVDDYGLFQQDNMPNQCLKKKLFEEHEKDFKVLPWRPTSPDLCLSLSCFGGTRGAYIIFGRWFSCYVWLVYLCTYITLMCYPFWWLLRSIPESKTNQSGYVHILKHLAHCTCNFSFHKTSLFEIRVHLGCSFYVKFIRPVTSRPSTILYSLHSDLRISYCFVYKSCYN